MRINLSSPPIDMTRLSARKKAFPQSNFVSVETLERYVEVATRIANSSRSYFLDLWSIMRLESDYTKFLKQKDR